MWGLLLLLLGDYGALDLGELLRRKLFPFAIVQGLETRNIRKVVLSECLEKTITDVGSSAAVAQDEFSVVATDLTLFR